MKGFSLVELLVVIGIMMVLTVTGVVYINSFNSRQKIESTRHEITTRLRLARSLAVTAQLPAGSGAELRLRYVAVSFNSGGVMTARVNGVGDSYFSYDVSPSGIGVTLVPPRDIWFLAGEGKLVKNSGGNIVPLDTNETSGIRISSNEGIGDTLWVIVDYSGRIF